MKRKISEFITSTFLHFYSCVFICSEEMKSSFRLNHIWIFHVRRVSSFCDVSAEKEKAPPPCISCVSPPRQGQHLCPRINNICSVSTCVSFHGSAADFELAQLQERLRQTELVMEKIVSSAHHQPDRWVVSCQELPACISSV